MKENIQVGIGVLIAIVIFKVIEGYTGIGFEEQMLTFITLLVCSKNLKEDYHNGKK